MLHIFVIKDVKVHILKKMCYHVNSLAAILEWGGEKKWRMFHKYAQLWLVFFVKFHDKIIWIMNRAYILLTVIVQQLLRKFLHGKTLF